MLNEILEIKKTQMQGRFAEFTFAATSELLDQMIPKGSVAIDGISLTVNDVRKDSFDLMLIPLSLEHTTLGTAKPGDMVNIETDVLAKYVARQLEPKSDTKHGIDIELLTKSGFMR